MRAFSRPRGFISFGVLVLVAIGYSFAAKIEPARTPIERVETAVEPYRLRYDSEVLGNTRNFADYTWLPEIHVAPNWGRVELEKDGMSVTNSTEWRVGVISRGKPPQAALIDALNESPATAQQLLKHPDERIQFLLLEVLYNWGHNVKSILDDNQSGNRKLVSLQPHAVDALLTLAERNDPHTVGTVVGALRFKPMFSADVFAAAMNHNSSNIRAEALSWINSDRQQLTTADIETLMPILIEHLDDRDIVVREYSLSALQTLVAQWEERLGGANYETAFSARSKMTKLTNPEAIDNWHYVVSPQMLKSADQNQADWKAWFEAARQSTATAAASSK